MTERYVNGVCLPTEESRTSSSFRKTNGNIVAIDFGTQNCSVAYQLKGSKEPRLLKLDDTNTKERVTNTLLVHPDGSIINFGEEARTKYVTLSPTERGEYHYFHHIKMRLKGNVS